MSRIRKAARAAVVAQIFNWGGLLLSLVTVPVYLHWLGQERYGLLLTGLAFAGYLMFSDAGLTWASMLLIAQANGRSDRIGISAVVRNSFTLAICSALLVMVIVATVYWVLTRIDLISWLPRHPEFPGLILAVGISVVCNLALSPFYNLLIGLQEAHLAAIYQGSGRLFGTIAAVVIAGLHAPLGWVFCGNIAGALIAGILAAAHCRRRHDWAFRAGSFWQSDQIRQQLRTGAKSFAMQIGNVLWGTAPVLAISSVAGPQFVPFFSIPMTLLNAPLGIVSSFSASLQPGYGEAVGRGEKEWVADTVRRILRQVLVVIGFFGCGFLLLAAPFVRLWTGGRIDLEPKMLGSVLAIASAGALLGVFRFALSGINRHRLAAASDLICGTLAIVFSVAIVRAAGPAFVGFGIIGAALLTSGWILPRELKQTLETTTLLPSWSFWSRWLSIVGLTFLAGWAAFRWSPGADWLLVFVSGFSTCAIFALFLWKLLPDESALIRRLARPLTKHLIPT